MEVAPSVAEQLLALSGDTWDDEPLAIGLARLGRLVVGAVPSCLAVSIVLTRSGTRVVVGAGQADASTVRASMAVPLPGVEPGAFLLLLAGEEGAFLLLEDDLAGLLDPGRPPVLDADEQVPSASAASLAASLADLSSVNRGLGVLIEQGLPPDAAREELQRRADLGRMTLAQAGLAVLTPL